MGLEREVRENREAIQRLINKSKKIINFQKNNGDFSKLWLVAYNENNSNEEKTEKISYESILSNKYYKGFKNTIDELGVGSHNNFAILKEAGKEADFVYWDSNAWVKLGIDEKIKKSQIANNLTTTTEGKVLDARQGKVLDDKKLDKKQVPGADDRRFKISADGTVSVVPELGILSDVQLKDSDANSTQDTIEFTFVGGRKLSFKIEDLFASAYKNGVVDTGQYGFDKKLKFTTIGGAVKTIDLAPFFTKNTNDINLLDKAIYTNQFRVKIGLADDYSNIATIVGSENFAICYTNNNQVKLVQRVQFLADFSKSNIYAKAYQLSSSVYNKSTVYQFRTGIRSRIGDYWVYEINYTFFIKPPTSTSDTFKFASKSYDTSLPTNYAVKDADNDFSSIQTFKNKVKIERENTTDFLEFKRKGTATGRWGIMLNNNIGVDASFNIKDYTSNKIMFTINKTTGNVGIGVVNPSAKLDVNGRIKTEGFEVFSAHKIVGKNIPASAGATDLNTVNSGVLNNYGGISYWSNTPVLSYGMVETVNGADGNIIHSQRYTDIRHGYSNYSDHYVRAKNNTGWTGWSKLIHSNNFKEELKDSFLTTEQKNGADMNALSETKLLLGSQASEWLNTTDISVNKANAVLNINTHLGNYHSQLFFSTGKEALYVRHANGVDLSTKSWQKLLTEADLPYEEGSFTPILKAGNNAYTTGVAVGYYVKVGKLVHFSLKFGNITADASDITQEFRVYGFPKAGGVAPNYLQANAQITKYNGNSFANNINNYTPKFNGNYLLFSKKDMQASGDLYLKNISFSTNTTDNNVLEISGTYITN